MVSPVVNRASLYMPPACFRPVCDTNCGQIHSPQNQLLRRGKQRKGIWISIIFATIATRLYNWQFFKTIRWGETPPEIIMSYVNRASAASAGDKLVAVSRFNDVSAQFATTAVMYDFGLGGIALISVVVAHDWYPPWIRSVEGVILSIIHLMRGNVNNREVKKITRRMN